MGKQWKQWQTLFSWASKSLQIVTAAMKLKMLAPQNENYDKPRQCIKKQRHHFANKVHTVKATFPVVMYGCESWIIKKAKYQRSDAFRLWFWRRLLRVPWTPRKPNQSILKEINLEYSLEGLMLKLQYFGHLMRRIDSLEKTLMLGRLKVGEEADDKGWDGWMPSSTQWTWVWAISGRWWRTGKPGVLQFMGSQRERLDWVTEQQILPNTPLPPRLPHHIKIPR